MYLSIVNRFIMKRKTIVKDDKSLWTSPGKMTHDDFLAGIRNAEDGPFYTLDELNPDYALEIIF